MKKLILMLIVLIPIVYAVEVNNSDYNFIFYSSSAGYKQANDDYNFTYGSGQVDIGNMSNSEYTLNKGIFYIDSLNLSVETLVTSFKQATRGGSSGYPGCNIEGEYCLQSSECCGVLLCVENYCNEADLTSEALRNELKLTYRNPSLTLLGKAKIFSMLVWWGFQNKLIGSMDWLSFPDGAYVFFRRLGALSSIYLGRVDSLVSQSFRNSYMLFLLSLVLAGILLIITFKFTKKQYKKWKKNLDNR